MTETDSVKGDVTVAEPSRAQQLVARRTAESRATVPDVTLSVDADVEDALALVADLGYPVLDDAVVKAAALALRDVPEANGAYRDARFERYSRVNVGVVVPTSDGLVVPTLFDADAKSLAQLAEEHRDLVARVHEGSLRAPDLGGATFTVSVLDVDRFTAVVIPPQAGALAAGAPVQRAVVRDGAVTPRHVVTLTLSCDHRILYGAVAARLLTRMRELLEQPAALV
jgi:pyruvate dehydrogenase E2 component (dihydrolipoamide acetyltransferase)